MNRKLFKLFTTMFSLSAFTLGGGYVIIPLMQKRFVEQLKWLKEDEMLDMVALARSAPGAVTVNVAVQAGYKLAGIPGIISAVAGTVLPPVLVLAAVSVFYDAFIDNRIMQAFLFGLRAAVAAVVADGVGAMVWRIFKNGTPLYWIIMALSAMLTIFGNVSALVILLAAGIAAVVWGRNKAC